MKLHTKSQAPKEGKAEEPKSRKPVGLNSCLMVVRSVPPRTDQMKSAHLF